MSLDLLLQNQYKPWLNARVNSIAIDNDLTVSMLGGVAPAIGDALVATDTLGTIGFSAAPVGSVLSVSNLDGSLTISPTTGAVIASINLAHSNTFSAAQTMPSIKLTAASNQIVAQLGGVGNSQTINMADSPAVTQIVSVPDMGVAAGNFVLTQGSTQTIVTPVVFSGNNVSFSFSPSVPGAVLYNVAGASIGYAQGSISLSGFNNSFTTAVTLLNAPGAGLFYRVLSLNFKVTYGGTPWAGSGVVQISPPGGPINMTISNATITGIAANAIVIPTNVSGSVDQKYTTGNIVNQQVILTTTTGNWTGGTASTITYSMVYEVDTFP